VYTPGDGRIVPLPSIANVIVKVVPAKVLCGGGLATEFVSVRELLVFMPDEVPTEHALTNRHDAKIRIKYIPFVFLNISPFTVISVYSWKPLLNFNFKRNNSRWIVFFFVKLHSPGWYWLANSFYTPLLTATIRTPGPP
jgi:hypothetical protein